MRYVFSGILACGAMLLAGCGMSAADKTAVGGAWSVMQTEALSARRKAMLQVAKDIQREQNEEGRCTASGPTSVSGDFTVTVECPSASTTKVTLATTEPISRSCGADTITVDDLTAVITFSISTRTSYSFTLDIDATVNTKTLDCAFSMTFDSSNPTGSTVSDANYSCTYGGSSVDASTFSEVQCST